VTKLENAEEHKSLDTLAPEINAEHRAFVGTFRKTVEHGIRAGSYRLLRPPTNR
jgi:hypothetical protein